MDNVKDKCGSDAAACYEVRGGICYVYTQKPRAVFDTKLHEAMGHEMRHCFEGDFHPREGATMTYKQLVRGF